MADVNAVAYDVGVAAPKPQERRRPGRLDNASPELIALMRKPSDEARRKIALYDAPHFVPPPARRSGGSLGRLRLIHVAIAVPLCGLAWAAAFEAMMWAWS